eukprot:scaffold162915_cov19-Prasinocladus_malaysianus.AAC.1
MDECTINTTDTRMMSVDTSYGGATSRPNCDLFERLLHRIERLRHNLKDILLGSAYLQIDRSHCLVTILNRFSTLLRLSVMKVDMERVLSVGVRFLSSKGSYQWKGSYHRKGPISEKGPK